MAKFRKVSSGMWADEKFRRLSPPQPNGQSLWQWLITGPRTTNIPGIVLGTFDELAASIRWPAKGFREAFGELFRERMVKADDNAGLVFLPRGVTHNPPDNPNVVRSWRSTWEEVPECPLKHEVWRTLKQLCERLGEGFAKGFAEACGDGSPNQEQEQEQEQEQNTDALPSADVQPTLLSIPPVPRFDFEAVYKRYPRKRGKPGGMDACRKLIRTPGDFEALSRGVDSFAAETRRLGTPQDKIPYWSTWVNERRWEDFADEPATPKDDFLDLHASGTLR